jgi:hypothetical protein
VKSRKQEKKNDNRHFQPSKHKTEEERQRSGKAIELKVRIGPQFAQRSKKSRACGCFLPAVPGEITPEKSSASSLKYSRTGKGTVERVQYMDVLDVMHQDGSFGHQFYGSSGYAFTHNPALLHAVNECAKTLKYFTELRLSPHLLLALIRRCIRLNNANINCIDRGMECSIPACSYSRHANSPTIANASNFAGEDGKPGSQKRERGSGKKLVWPLSMLWRDPHLMLFREIEGAFNGPKGLDRGRCS